MIYDEPIDDIIYRGREEPCLFYLLHRSACLLQLFG